MYFGVTVTFLLEYFIRKPERNMKYYLLSLYPIGLGGLIEIVQSVFTTTRSGDWIDFFADVLGVVFAYLTFHYLRHFRPVAWYINKRTS
jgi:hypothetical protein